MVNNERMRQRISLRFFFSTRSSIYWTGTVFKCQVEREHRKWTCSNIKWFLFYFLGSRCDWGHAYIHLLLHVWIFWHLNIKYHFYRVPCVTWKWIIILKPNTNSCCVWISLFWNSIIDLMGLKGVCLFNGIIYEMVAETIGNCIKK